MPKAANNRYRTPCIAAIFCCVAIVGLVCLFQSSFVAESAYFRQLRIAYQSIARRHVVIAHDQTPFCKHQAKAEAVNKGVYLLDAKLPGRCSAGSSDDMLVLRCRLNKQRQGTPPVHTPLACPVGVAPTEEALNHEETKKYTQRGDEADGRCMGMWGMDWTLAHKCVAVYVAEKFNLQPGALVFDWGSGCGHSLTILKQLFDVDGIGMDFQPGAVDWARKHSLGQFCAGDGRHMDWLPDNHFDAAFCFGALMHLHNATEECHVIREMYRITKPGGNVFVGWMGTIDPLSPNLWAQCGLPEEATLQVLNEKGLYPAAMGISEFDLLSWGQQSVEGIDRSSYAIFVHKPNEQEHSAHVLQRLRTLRNFEAKYVN